MAARRLSLSKSDRRAGIGAELLTLCQSITSDGRLNDLEIGELRQWLRANRTADLPAIGFLVETVERILADGIVTDQERQLKIGAAKLREAGMRGERG